MTAHHTPTGPAWPLVTIASATLGALLCTSAWAAPARPPAKTAPPAAGRTSAPVRESAPRDSASLTLRGGDEGTVFRSLTVEGEDRIHIEVERPALALGLDPEQAPGLAWGGPLDVLARSAPDGLAPLLDRTAAEPSPFTARPWLAHFPAGPVARVRPDVKGVEQWKLTFVDERGATAAAFAGRGDPPAEVAWDGRTGGGAFVQPGVTYSYVFEARDRAGNRRNFVGEGFRVAAFRTETPDGPVLAFTGAELRPAPDGGEAPPVVLEVAAALNRAVPAPRRIRVEVTARAADEAAATAQRLVRWLGPLLLGDPARLESATSVRPDAPAGGAVRVASAR